MQSLPIKTNKNRQKGQALLLVLLSMAAVLTIVLSAASRSVTDISVTSSEEDALRAFSAAEAGVERSLLSGEGGSGNPDPQDNTVNFDTVVDREPEGNSFIYPGPISTGESATFWFADRNSAGDFDCSAGNCLGNNKISALCWGNNPPYSNASERPAVMLSIYYDETERYLAGDFSNVSVARKGFDPVASRTGSNNFTSAGGGACTVGQEQFSFSMRDIQFNQSDMGIPPTCNAGCLILAKVRVFYNNPARPEQVAMTFVGQGGRSLPAQGSRIESTGVAGESERKINVFQSFAEPPSIFDTAVFSLSDFAKN